MRAEMIMLGLAALALSACSEPQAQEAQAPQTSTPIFHADPVFKEKGYPFSQAVEVGGFIFLSGQIGTAPGSDALVEGGIEAEARQTMDNIGAALDGLGLSFDDVVKCTVMIDDMADWPAFNAVYASYFEGDFPARSAFGADGLALGAAVEVECIAWRSS